MLWLRHYYPTHFTAEYIGAFLLVTTWTVPFLLFLSLAGDQAVLPGAAGVLGAAACSSPACRQRRTLLLGLSRKQFCCGWVVARGALGSDSRQPC